MNKKQPVLKIEPSRNDKLIDVLSLLGIALLLIIPLYYYGQLPAEIPSHFNGAGEPDAYSSKTSIWLLPVVGIVMGLGMMALTRIPHLYNYPVKITEENAKKQYRGAARLIRILNFLITFAFVYIIIGTIQMGLGNAKGLGNGFLTVFLVAIFGVIGLYLSQSTKKE